MAFSRTGLRKIAFLGATAANTRPRVLYAFTSNDLFSVIAGTGYLNDLINELGIGDVIMVVADIDGTPDPRIVVVSSVTTNVAFVYGLDKVTGDQTAIADMAAISGGEAPTEAEHNLIITKVNAILAMQRTSGLLAAS